MSKIQEAVDVATDGVATKREKAVALHDYVRDQIKFGFNRYFDMSRPDHTLELEIGHCNAKSELMVALFREAGLEANHHFVVLPREIIKGVIPPSISWLIPKELSHCYAEVKLEGTFRTMNEEWRAKAHKHITEIATKIAIEMKGTVDVNIMKGYPVDRKSVV